MPEIVYNPNDETWVGRDIDHTAMTVGNVSWSPGYDDQGNPVSTPDQWHITTGGDYEVKWTAQLEEGVCYACDERDPDIRGVCPTCKDAIRYMKEHLLAKILKDIEDFSDE